MTRNRLNTPTDLYNLRDRLNRDRDPNKVTIAICAGTGCMACGCKPVAEAFREAVNRENLSHEVEIQDHRLSRVLRAWPARPYSTERNLLSASQAHRCQVDHGNKPSKADSW